MSGLLKRSVIAVTMVLIYLLAITTPALAFTPFNEETAPTGQLNYKAEYSFDGSAKQKMQAGHLCNTGAQMKQVIYGDGSMTKTTTLLMTGGYIEVADSNDWVTAPDALRNLEVTSVIELCAPPKSLFTQDGSAFASVVALLTEAIYYLLNEVSLSPVLDDVLEDLLAMVLQFPKYYTNQPAPPIWNYTAELFPLVLPTDIQNDILFIIDMLELMIETDNTLDPTEIYLLNVVVSTLKVIVGESDLLDSLTRQVWAAYVSADPGHTGTLNQDFKAAEGPWGGISFPAGGELGRLLISELSDDEDYINAVLWQIGLRGMSFGDEELYLFGKPRDYNFWFDLLEYPYITAEVGSEFVGSFFTIDQLAATSQGTVKRFIEISSPWSHAYLTEEMTFTGSASIEESFSMENLPAGKDIPGLWWTLF